MELHSLAHGNWAGSCGASQAGPQPCGRPPPGFLAFGAPWAITLSSQQSGHGLHTLLCLLHRWVS